MFHILYGLVSRENFVGAALLKRLKTTAIDTINTLQST